MPHIGQASQAAVVVAAATITCLSTITPPTTITQDSQDPNPLIRALAVRTMGCIRVDKITEYLCDPLQRCLKVCSSSSRAMGVCLLLPRFRNRGRQAVGGCRGRAILWPPGVGCGVFCGGLKPPFLPYVCQPTTFIAAPLHTCRTTTRTCARPRPCVCPSCLTSTLSWWRTGASWTCSGCAGGSRRCWCWCDM